MTYPSAKRKNDEARSSVWRSVGRGIVSVARAVGKYTVVLPAKGAWWLISKSAQGVWWLTRSVVEGTWRVVKWAVRNLWAALVWTINLPLRVFRFLFIEPLPEFENSRQAALYKLVKRHYRRRRWFVTHAFLYGAGWAITLIQLYSLFRLQELDHRDLSASISSTLAFIGVWTMVILFHFVRVRLGEAEDRSLTHVLERDYRYPSYEYAYQDDSYHERLSEASRDDEPDYEYYVETFQKAKR